jgi:hypothetical protein
VYAQWKGGTEGHAATTLLSLTPEPDCLHPEPTRVVYTVVDEEGSVRLIAQLPHEGIVESDPYAIEFIYQT